MSQTSMGHALDRRDPEQQSGRERIRQSPPDIYDARMSRLLAEFERREAAKRELNK